MTHKAQHTPGPWSYAIDSEGIELSGGDEQHTTIQSDSGFGSIAKVMYKKVYIMGDSKRLARETFEANVCLIAAAPDLLNSLTCLIESVIKSAKEYDSPFNGDDEVFTAIAAARTAIDSATNLKKA